MKLNLGCGEDIQAGYINVDALPNRGVDVVCDITQKLPFDNNSIDEIIAQDILEHLTREQLLETLGEISRILKQEGLFKVRIPDIDAIFNKFTNDHETRNLFLYGDTSQTGVWGAHKAGYSQKTFVALCRLNNLELMTFNKLDTNFELEFKKTAADIKIKKVLFINQSLGLGGAETFNLGLITWLKQRGISVQSWVTHPRFAKALSARQLPVVLDIIGDWKGLIKAVFLWPWGVVMYWWAVWQSRDADLVLLTGFIEKIMVTPLAKLLRMGVVWIEFGPLETVFNKFLGLPKFLYRLVSQMPDIVIMPTGNTYKANVAICQIPAAKIKIIPCAIEKPVNAKHHPEKNLAVCISRLEKGKGQDLLIQVWPEVLKKIPDAKLKIIGEGSLDLKPCKNVVITGWVKDVWKVLEKASVLVFPSVWPLEGFGLVMIEAMSLGIPIVAFNRGTAREIIDESSGVLVDDLSEGLIAMLQKPIHTGRKRYQRLYSWPAVGPQYLQAFKYAMAKKQIY